MTRKGVDMVLLKDLPDLSSTDDLVSMQFVDYREAPPTRQDFQRCFSGVPIAISIETQEHHGSYEREISSFVVHNGHFYPGMLHNMFLPAFDVRWGDSKLRRLVDSFRWKLIERLRYEKEAFPNEILRISFAHTRSEVFAPHTTASVDASTNLHSTRYDANLIL